MPDFTVPDTLYTHIYYDKRDNTFCTEIKAVSEDEAIHKIQQYALESHFEYIGTSFLNISTNKIEMRDYSYYRNTAIYNETGVGEYEQPYNDYVREEYNHHVRI